MFSFFFFFFFQAEDGIRDRNVTGVQTCALPISLPTWPCTSDATWRWCTATWAGALFPSMRRSGAIHARAHAWRWWRSEERRVGKEGRCGGGGGRGGKRRRGEEGDSLCASEMRTV